MTMVSSAGPLAGDRQLSRAPAPGCRPLTTHHRTPAATNRFTQDLVPILVTGQFSRLTRQRPNCARPRCSWPSRVQVDVLDASSGVLVPGLVGPAEHRGGVALPAGRHLDQGQLLHGRICSSRALRLIAATSIACQNILPAFHVRTLRQHSDPVQGQISPLLPERDMGLACTRQPAWQRRPGTGRIPRRHTSVSVPRLRTSRTHSPAC